MTRVAPGVGGVFVLLALCMAACDPSSATPRAESSSSQTASAAQGAAPPTPSPQPQAPSPAPAQPPVAPPEVEPPPAAPGAIAVAEPVAVEVPTKPAPVDVYSGVHKLGVNRVTDMARVGSVTFAKRDGGLHLQGRVARGQHWLALAGTVHPEGNDRFVLDGHIEGVPDMAWNNEAPRERRTEGRFTFRVTKRRPYWRLYEVNGKDCVCWDGCGNDFCYIDIEQHPNP